MRHLNEKRKEYLKGLASDIREGLSEAVSVVAPITALVIFAVASVVYVLNIGW